jgi:hypothetical protein
MRRASRQRLLLLFAAMALLALAGWQWQRDTQAAPGALLTLAPTTISHIALTLAGTPTAHYEKHDGHWWLVDGMPVRADDGRLGELADTAAAAVLSWRPASDFQPAQIGLTPPLAVLRLDDQLLEFGETSVTGPQRYVRVGDRVALVSVRYTPRPPTTKITELH